MERSLVCPVCNKRFTTDKNAVKYCSDFCRRRAARKFAKSSDEKLVCSYCGKPFVSDRRKKYCSVRCRVAANRGKTPPQAPPSLSLSQVVFLSREAGLSYGRYVEKLMLAR